MTMSKRMFKTNPLYGLDFEDALRLCLGKPTREQEAKRKTEFIREIEKTMVENQQRREKESRREQ